MDIPEWTRRFLNYWKPRFRRYLKDEGSSLMEDFAKPILRGERIDWTDLLMRKLTNDRSVRGLPEDEFQELMIGFAEAEDNDNFSDYTTESIEANPWSIEIWKSNKQDFLKYKDYMPIKLRDFLIKI